VTVIVQAPISAQTGAAITSKVSAVITPSDLFLTGKDGIGKPVTQHLSGRILSARRTRTILGASTIVIELADPDRGVLTAPVLSTGLPKISDVASELLGDANTRGAVTADGNAADLPGGSVYRQQVGGGAGASGEVERNKQLLVQLGVNLGVPREAVVIAMMTMLDETGGVNDTSPDENGSSGLMQQTPSQGWGTREQVNDPVYAINKFYKSLLAVPGWQNMSPWVAAQRVQRSAWTGNPNRNNNFSSEVGGNYHLKYNEALQAVAGYRPGKSTVLDTAVSNNAKGIVSVSSVPTASLTVQGIDYSLVRVDTGEALTTLTFEDALVNQLRRNKDPYSSGKPTSIPLFVNQLLLQSTINPHFVQQGLVVSRVDPTGALDAGQSDPATLANFDQLLATDGQRGTGTLKVLTKFANTVVTDPVTGTLGSADGIVQDSWTVINSLISPLRWVAMSNGQDIFVGSEVYVSHYIDQPVLILRENQNGVGWLKGEFDVDQRTSNELTFTVYRHFTGVPAQRVIIMDAGVLSGMWMIQSVSDSVFSDQFEVVLQRIQADLQDAEHQAATDKLLTTGGGVTSTNSGELAGAKPTISGQVSQNGWAAGDAQRANIATYTVPGTGVRLDMNRQCATVLLWVAQQFHQRVEPLDGGQCGGYSDRLNVNDHTVWSNHASGTAIDLNALKHPNGVPADRTFSAAQIATIHDIVKALHGAVRWGDDYKSTPDSMHFEINTDATGVGVASSLVDPRLNEGQGHVTGGH
jgi:hypothetical protein